MQTSAKTILIADDDLPILDALSIMLDMAGYRVITSTGIDIFEKIEASSPDLLLLDVWMSGADGRDLCRKIKKNSTLPVIMISASKETRESSLESGADYFITKPFEMKEFLATIEEALSKRYTE